ncbi:MAG TPA: carbon monoxide dehydrogenase subunit G [Ramlibacter sp.]|nr:carbon monoxide dehydrogenase subunit G [Ramlibacter sp.]
MSMEMTGEYRIPAPRQRVWEALNDPAVLKACIPGCQQLEKVSDTDFTAIVATKVGPVSATFRGSVNLTELDPPNGYTLTGQGQGGAAGFARMGARVSLKDESDDTLLAYAAHADIGGKLASVGSRLVQTVARKNADDFFSAFARHLGGTGVQEPSVAVAPAGVSPGVPAGVPMAVWGRGLGSPVPAWLVVFCTGLGLALGYCIALLAR